jgi:hypothetical protein
MHPARFLDGVLADVPLEQFLGIRIALWIVALAPLFTIRKLGTIASIDAADRARVLTVLLASPIYAVRQLTISIKAIASLLYSQSASVYAAMVTPRTPGGIVALRRKQKGSTGAHEHAAAE